MDTKKLDKWAELLLDTGKRNNLINFKDTKASTAEIVLPTSNDLFEKIEGTASFEVFDPKIAEDDSGAATETHLAAADTTDVKAAYIAQYAARIKRKSQILLYNAYAGPMAAVKNIDKKAREFIEEAGVNVAYMAFGFIHWKESDTSQFECKAPVLLVPIQLERESAVMPYYIKSTGDEAIINPTFAYKLNAEYGIKLPAYEESGLESYLEKVRAIVAKLRWSVTSECKIGIFSFLKINMYQDLKENTAAILANTNVQKLLGESAGNVNFGFGIDTDGNTHLNDPLIELHSVVDADSSQIEAIEMAKSGKSFVLQGPPGTGKSQTITNMIAECLGDGKKVLFVSEKLAALNIVYDKLKQAGLSEFCLELHSHKANKKAVIDDICHTLRAEKRGVSSRAEGEIAIKSKAKQQLDAYAIELHKRHSVIEKSLYELYEDHARMRSAPEVEWPIPQIYERDLGYLRNCTSLLEQFAIYTRSVGINFKKNPWYGYIGQDATYQTKTEIKNALADTLQFLKTLNPILQHISKEYGTAGGSINDAYSWRDFFHLAASSRFITPALLQKDHFDAAYVAVQELQYLSADILADKAAIDNDYDTDLYKEDGADYHKKLTRQFDSFFARIFNAEYKQIISALRLCRKDGAKVPYREAEAITEHLSAYQEKTRAFDETAASVLPFFGPDYAGVETDWPQLVAQMDQLKKITTTGLSFGELPNLPDFEGQREVFAQYAEKLDNCLAGNDNSALDHIAESFDREIWDIRKSNAMLSEARCDLCFQEIDKLDNWCHFRNLLAQLDEAHVLPFVEAASRAKIQPEKFAAAFEKQFYYQWIDFIIAGTPVLSTFTRVAQDQAIHTFAEKDKEQFEINKAKVRATLSAQRPSLDMIASGSALSILLREGEKKRKLKSIRSLLAETGEVVQRVKPCFLMSPLSVSTFLTADSVHFDVVIFDEASQIFPQDAIGAIYRADQLIVVGDSRQMPPSNFFMSTLESDDDDEEVGDITDFESILDLCSTSMQQLRLCWHYRSRYEELITFSNRNFYDNSLITFPSAMVNVPGTGVDYYHIDGVFDRKSHTNRKEAEFIVYLIYDHIKKYPDRSLGVVAFSVAQQDLIDKLLSQKRQNNPEYESFFKSDVKEPFFIKNLETVQGDERDTIIFSVAYGSDEQGRLLLNFGPLNRAGGERRLNVAVTRAKYNIILVSSMHYTDIDLRRTSSAGAALLRDYLNYAENGERALEQSIKVDPYDQFDSDFEMEVCDFLRENGFSVDTQIGCSGYKIDLALKVPNKSDYVLAIECDGATYHSSKNARDRDRLRQEILEGMGWRFYRIWSTDWFRNKAVEKQRLLDAANAALSNPARKVRSNVNQQQPTETFEEIAAVQTFDFPAYEDADVWYLYHQYKNDFKAFVRAILEVEAPVSEEYLLKQIIWYFDREKVTNVVWQSYENLMAGCNRYGIIRHNGFLYLRDKTSTPFRCADKVTRDIKYIAPEELAMGMREIIKQNVTVEKSGLYQLLARQCGFSRVGRGVNDCFDAALRLLNDTVIIDGDRISMKKP